MSFWKRLFVAGLVSCFVFANILQTTHADTFRPVVRGKRGVTPETAWLLAQAFATTPEFWISLQTNYDLAVNRPSKVTPPLRKAG